MALSAEPPHQDRCGCADNRMNTPEQYRCKDPQRGADAKLPVPTELLRALHQRGFEPGAPGLWKVLELEGTCCLPACDSGVSASLAPAPHTSSSQPGLGGNAVEPGLTVAGRA